MYQVREPMDGVVYPPAERLRYYVEAGELPQTSLVEALMESLRRNAARVALSSAEGELSYAELDAVTDKVAHGLLGLGLRPLDRVMFQMGNSRELILAVVGCLKAGLIPVCSLAAHREKEIEFLGNHVQARAHIVQGDDAKFDLETFALQTQERIPSIAHVLSLRGQPRAGVMRIEDLVARADAAEAAQTVARVPRDPFQVAIFQLSGGTTGVPKAIPRFQNDYLLNARLSMQWMGFTESDVLFMPMPMIHNAAMICFWLPSLLAGAEFAIPVDMTPEAWGRVFTERRPTFIGLIRALLPRLDGMLDQGLGRLERVRGAWAPDAAKVIHEKYAIAAQPMFGMSEGLNMYCRADDPVDARDWTVGVPVSALDEVRLVDPESGEEVPAGEVGEFTCRGPYTLSGYYKAPERNRETFTADGFYRSGDLMVQREIEGRRFYAFAGRTRDTVVRGHEKVNCEELESGVSTHPAVAGCAVVGMPDPVLGERVCAYIVLRYGVGAPTVADLGQHLQRQGFAKFKWPERIEIIDAIPLTRVGKLDKAPLRTAIEEKLKAESPEATTQG